MNGITKNKDGASSDRSDNDSLPTSSGSYESSEGLDSEEENISSTNSISSDSSSFSGSRISGYDDESSSEESSNSNRLSDEDGSSRDAPSQHSSTSSSHHTTEQQHQNRHSQTNIAPTTAYYPNNTLIHRRGKSNNGQLPQCKPNKDSPDQPSRSKYRRDKHINSKRSSSRRSKSSSSNNNNRNLLFKYICCQTNKKSTQILLFAFLLWIFAQTYYFYYHWNSKSNSNGGRIGRRRGNKSPMMGMVQHHQLSNPKSLEEMEVLRKQRMIEAQRVLGSAAGGGERDTGGKPNNRRDNNRSREGRKNKKSGSKDSEGNTRTERLREGCSTLKWHSYNFPNCNEIHEIDLRHVIERGRSKKHTGEKEREEENDEEEDSNDIESRATTMKNPSYYPWGFVGNGLWRDVFTCDPREETLVGTTATSPSFPPQPPVVLKIMKSEHKYDIRNINRHRRDALVMERLSSSHHLVPIYGYCAQTVLTQAISHTLDDVIYAREHERVKKWSPNGGYKSKPPLESWMGTDEDGELLLTRETEIGRIKLALGVFRGLVDLHEGVDDDSASTTENNNEEWLPIVHADLQSKQYLVDAQTGHVYLNDFNRCRFMTKKDQPATNDGGGIESCPLYIPSAPGSSRSPEEYSREALSEKLDVYSAGNVLYGIITGKRPWNNERGKHIKEDIQDGKRPEVDESIRNAKGTVDAVLTHLLDRVYEHDPEERASAREIVDELEDLLEVELMKRERKNKVS